VPPEITFTLTIQSSGNDNAQDKAVVAGWLTKLTAPWEATLTYKYFLPEADHKKYAEEIRVITDTDSRKKWDVLDNYRRKYVSRIYGGNLASQNRADPEYLNKFHCEMLDALRDVESNMFLGSNTLLKQVLKFFIDSDLDELKESEREMKRTSRKQTFTSISDGLVAKMIDRISLSKIFDLADKTGAAAGGAPTLGGSLNESDVLSILRLMVKMETGIEVPIINNGMGYNNLIYISLLLSKFQMLVSPELGENAKVFPMLLIEEPEAHLHPALQYCFLKFLKDEIDAQKTSRQIFITTHSTHITAAVGLDPIICMNVDPTGKAVPAYPGRVFSDKDEDVESKKYIARYLDATKSAMLFSKATLLVEGLAEQLLLPTLAEYACKNLATSHVSTVYVGALTFKHFIKLFGAGIQEDRKKYAIRRRVACIIDSDPTRLVRVGKNRRWEKCYPFEIGLDPEIYEYNEHSGAIRNLIAMKQGCDNVDIYYKKTHGKTFEYDMALENSTSDLIFDDSFEIVEFDGLENSNWVPTEKEKAKKAASYLVHVEKGKGEPALNLAVKLTENLHAKDEKQKDFIIPQHILDALKWVCYEAEKGATCDAH
jgi:putative ATP-dependent endonuclease of the OLD family